MNSSILRLERMGFVAIGIPATEAKISLSDQLRGQIQSYGPAKVSAQTGIAKSVISRFLNGKDITLSTAEKILELLGSN